MSDDVKYFKFFFAETGEVIEIYRVGTDVKNLENVLESRRQKLAFENGIEFNTIDYIEVAGKTASGIDPNTDDFII